MRQIKTLLPLQGDRLQVEARWYAQRGIPRWMVSFFSFVASRALEQDRQVWENKIFRRKPMLVSGDGPFPAFVRWYDQFYSENSKKLEQSMLDW
jgi:hypothetical protein